MEGILLVTVFSSPVALLSGLVLIAIAWSAILLGSMADREASGRKIFWAESPFTDVSEAPPEIARHARAA